MEDFTEMEGNYKIDNKRALRKWAPILDALKIEGEDLRLFMAVYSEYFQLQDNMQYAHFDNFGGGMGPVPQTPIKNSVWNADLVSYLSEDWVNLLPVNLKILSKLNLKGKKYEIKKKMPKIEFDCELTKEEYDDIVSATGLDIVQKLENHFIDMVVDEINKQLETKDTLHIECLVQNFIIKKDGKPVLTLESKFEVV